MSSKHKRKFRSRNKYDLHRQRKSTPNYVFITCDATESHFHCVYSMKSSLSVQDLKDSRYNPKRRTSRVYVRYWTRSYQDGGLTSHMGKKIMKYLHSFRSLRKEMLRIEQVRVCCGLPTLEIEYM